MQVQRGVHAFCWGFLWSYHYLRCFLMATRTWPTIFGKEGWRRNLENPPRKGSKNATSAKGKRSGVLHNMLLLKWLLTIWDYSESPYETQTAPYCRYYSTYTATRRYQSFTLSLSALSGVQFAVAFFPFLSKSSPIFTCIGLSRHQVLIQPMEHHLIPPANSSAVDPQLALSWWI